MLKKIFKIYLFLGLFFLLAPGLKVQAQELSEDTAVIYYNEACGMCAIYVRDEMPKMLEENGISKFIKKDYINEKSNRPEMNKIMDRLGVPLELQSHIMTFVSLKSKVQSQKSKVIILGGHVPKHIIDGVFENQDRFKRVIVYQDKMHGEAEDYKVLAIPNYADNYVGEIKTYPIEARVTEYLDYLEKNKDELSVSDKYGWIKKRSLLPTILISGFLDGINPCAFAVLLFFIAFLFSLKRTKAAIWRMGIVYTSAIYLAYLLIGFGITKAILFTDSPHFMAKLGAWLVIILGGINLVNHFFPKFPLKLRIPQASKETIKYWVYKATLPAAFVLGFLVGLCTFPCSGGIYVAIIGLLVAKTTYWTGVGYLLLYNLMFVVPLIIILVLSSNKYAVEKLTTWEQSESKAMRILSAAVMIGLGAVILVWFT